MFFRFEGTPSGDDESFCWDVDKETFIKINGREPKEYEKSMIDEELYRIYPGDLHRSKKKCLIEFNYTEL